MTVIADSSFIYALYSKHDSNHFQAKEFASTYPGNTIIPDIILPEVCYLFLRDIGYAGMRDFFVHFKEIDSPLAPLVRTDLNRIHEITEMYASAEFDIVDCCIMALAERLQITGIATFDRRDFSIFRPRHCDFLELLPQ